MAPFYRSYKYEFLVVLHCNYGRIFYRVAMHNVGHVSRRDRLFGSLSRSCTVGRG